MEQKQHALALPSYILDCLLIIKHTFHSHITYPCYQKATGIIPVAFLNPLPKLGYSITILDFNTETIIIITLSVHVILDPVGTDGLPFGAGDGKRNHEIWVEGDADPFAKAADEC